MNTSTIEKTVYEPFGLTENFDKLRDYVEIDPSILKENDHYRYTCNIYQSNDRKVVYGIVVGIEDGKVRTKSYQSSHDPWLVDPNHKFKKYRF